MEMGLSNGKGSPRVDLGFVEPWTRNMFALGFVKPTELCRRLPRTGLGFCRPVRISKCEAFHESYVQRKRRALACMPLTKWQVLERNWLALAYVPLTKWQVLEANRLAFAYVPLTKR